MPCRRFPIRQIYLKQKKRGNHAIARPTIKGLRNAVSVRTSKAEAHV